MSTKTSIPGCLVLSGSSFKGLLLLSSLKRSFFLCSEALYTEQVRPSSRVVSEVVEARQKSNAAVEQAKYQRQEMECYTMFIASTVFSPCVTLDHLTVYMLHKMYFEKKVESYSMFVVGIGFSPCVDGSIPRCCELPPFKRRNEFRLLKTPSSHTYKNTYVGEIHTNDIRAQRRTIYVPTCGFAKANHLPTTYYHPPSQASHQKSCAMKSLSLT